MLLIGAICPAAAGAQESTRRVELAASDTAAVLVRSGRMVHLDGTYRLLSAGAHASPVVAAAGDSLDLAVLRGKTVFLDFWASWCRPCLVEIPELNAFAEEFAGREDVVFISVNQDALTSGGDLDVVHKLLGERSIRYPVLIDDAEPSLKKMFKVRAWPTRVLINAGGEILEPSAGRLTLEAAAEHLRGL